MDDTPRTGDPAAAFDQMRGELALLRRAIEGLTAEKERAPDYSETLGQMDGRLERIAHNIVWIAEQPAMTLTPDAMAQQIEEAGRKMREKDAATISSARGAFEDATAKTERREQNARTVVAQKRFVLLAVGAAVAATTLLCSFLPGTVARSLPESWLVPERMAARTLRLDRWSAGERLLAIANPDQWRAVLRAYRIVQDNREAIEACERAAASAREPVRCSIRIGLQTR